jgi:nicotinamide mononucleotide (NMN) deamidase PncC
VPLTPSRLVGEIHRSPLRIVLATTGGGASSLDHLLVVPGASRTVLEGVVPYSAAALRRFLGAAPEHYCAPETARAMAMAAFQRALCLAKEEGLSEAEPGGLPLAGIGCTASLATDRPKRGPHRAHVAAQTATVTITQSIELAKGHRRRFGEEKLVGRLVLNLVAQAAELTGQLDLSLTAGEVVGTSRTAGRPEWTQLLLGQVPAVRHGPAAPPAARRAVLPGAFNPRHEGHRRLVEIARGRLGGAPSGDEQALPTVCIEHEVSMVNVDKPPLDFTEMERRVAQFGPEETLWFTAAPRFEQKADLFPRATFLVGADTIARVGDARYYGGDPAARDRAIGHLAERGCRFLVFGRLVGDTFRSLGDLDLPPTLAALCEEISADEFRADVSSTELRRQAEV